MNPKLQELLNRSKKTNSTNSTSTNSPSTHNNSKLKTLISTDKEEKVENEAVIENTSITNKFKPSEEMYQIGAFDPSLFMHQLQEMEKQVIEKAPGIPKYLRDIHKNLSQYPELMHLLTDEQIQVVVSGYLKKTNVDMASVVTKKKTPKTPLSKEACEELF